MDWFSQLIIKHSETARIVAALIILLAFDHLMGIDYDLVIEGWYWNWDNISHNIVILYKGIIDIIYIMALIFGGLIFIIIYDDKKKQQRQ